MLIAPHYYCPNSMLRFPLLIGVRSCNLFRFFYSFAPHFLFFHRFTSFLIVLKLTWISCHQAEGRYGTSDRESIVKHRVIVWMDPSPRPRSERCFLLGSRRRPAGNGCFHTFHASWTSACLVSLCHTLSMHTVTLTRNVQFVAVHRGRVV
jgi:hypothetical protein